MSAEKLSDLTDEQLTAYLKPYFSETRRTMPAKLLKKVKELYDERTLAEARKFAEEVLRSGEAEASTAPSTSKSGFKLRLGSSSSK